MTFTSVDLGTVKAVFSEIPCRSVTNVQSVEKHTHAEETLFDAIVFT